MLPEQVFHIFSFNGTFVLNYALLGLELRFQAIWKHILDSKSKGARSLIFGKSLLNLIRWQMTLDFRLIINMDKVSLCSQF
jgi:hypothetical protein